MTVLPARLPYLLPYLLPYHLPYHLPCQLPSIHLPSVHRRLEGMIKGVAIRYDSCLTAVASAVRTTVIVDFHLFHLYSL